MKRNEAFPSRYLTKDDVRNGKLFTIKIVQLVEIEGESGPEKKPVIFFLEADSKPMILNMTNWAILEAAFGEDSDGWTDKKIVVYTDPNIMFGKKRVGGLRVRTP